MGYTSDWKLAAVGAKDSLEQLLAWMKIQASDCDQNENRDNADRRHTFETILAMSERRTQDSWVAQDEFTKCYDPWSSVIREVLEKGRDELKLDMAYARLGEDMHDYEFDNGTDVYIVFRRSLEEVVGLPEEKGNERRVG